MRPHLLSGLFWPENVGYKSPVPLCPFQSEGALHFLTHSFFPWLTSFSVLPGSLVLDTPQISSNNCACRHYKMVMCVVFL